MAISISQELPENWFTKLRRLRILISCLIYHKHEVFSSNLVLDLRNQLFILLCSLFLVGLAFAFNRIRNRCKSIYVWWMCSFNLTTIDKNRLVLGNYFSMTYFVQQFWLRNWLLMFLFFWNFIVWHLWRFLATFRRYLTDFLFFHGDLLLKLSKVDIKLLIESLFQFAFDWNEARVVFL